jgi:integrase
MAELIEDALPSITADKAPATVKLYTLAARKLQAILAEFDPHQVTPATVAQLRRGLASTPVMANRCVAVLRLVFGYALDEQLVDSNPVIGAKRIREHSRTRRITTAEFEAIREKASTRLRIVMDLCYCTGQRVGDVLSMKRDQLLADGVFVRQGKTKAELQIDWNPELTAAVEAAKAAHGRVSSMYLVKGIGARPLAYQPIWRDWRRACAAAGVAGANIHDLRAMSGSDAKRQGLDAKALLGHTSERMTQKYLRDREITRAQGPSIGQVLDKPPGKAHGS